MTRLPAAIANQAAQADQIQAQIDAANAAPQQIVPLTAEPQAQTPPQPQVPDAPESPMQVPTGENWEHKYKVLQGMFNTKMPEAQREASQLRTQLEDLQRKLAEREHAERLKAPEVDPADVEAFGKELTDWVHRTVQQLASQIAQTQADHERRITSLEQGVSRTAEAVGVTAEAAFYSQITAAVPDWEQINANQAFLAWLAESDPVYGVPRQMALTQAQSSLDAGRAIAVFRAWKQTQQAPQQARNTLVDQITPPQAASAPPQMTQSVEFVTQAQINGFYNDVRRGVYRGREAEAAQIEQRIQAAVQAGNVR